MGNFMSGFRTDFPNPGIPEDITKPCKDCFPNPFEGAKFSVTKALSQHFNVSHTVTLSNTMPSNYRFGATYIGANIISPTEAYPVLLGDIDPSGNLNANIIHQMMGWRMRCVTQFQEGKLGMSQISMDKQGRDWTLSLTTANPDALNNFSGVYVAQYLQSVSKSISLGSDLIYQRGPAVPGGQVAILKVVSKYQSPDDWSLVGSLGAGSASLTYFQKCSDTLKIGVECEGSLRVQEVVTTVGYAVEVPRINLTFKASLDSNWTVASVLEKKLLPLPLTMVMSSQFNHGKGAFRLGCGVLLG